MSLSLCDPAEIGVITADDSIMVVTCNIVCCHTELGEWLKPVVWDSLPEVELMVARSRV